MVTNKLSPSPVLPHLPQDASPYDTELRRVLLDHLGVISRKVNALTEGRAAAIYNADTATPASTVTQYAPGDFIRNKKPSEQGAAGSRYVVFGWQNVSAGSPGTFVEVRALTGN